MSLFVDVGLPVTAIPPGGVVDLQTDVTFELERVVPTERTTHYLWIVGSGYRRVLADLRSVSTVESLTTLDVHDDQVLVRLHWTTLDTPFLDLLDESDVVLVAAQGTAEGWETTLRFPDVPAVRTFYDTSEQRAFEVELRAVDGTRLGEHGDADILSAVQRATLEAAFEAGYFDVPRSITLTELADRLDRSEQAVSEALRRAMGNYLQATLQQDTIANGDSDESRGGPDRDTDDTSC